MGNQQNRESELKCNALSNNQMCLQRDLNESKSRITELESLLNDYVLENKYLENHISELKQSLTQNISFDSDVGVVPVSYAPESKPKLLRVRSNSAVSVMSFTDSAINSPVVNRNYNASFYQFYNTPSPTPKPFSLYHTNEEEAEDDLYQIMNGHLFEIEECVQKLYKLKQIKPKTRMSKARLSSFSLLDLSKDRKSVEEDDDDDQKEEEVEIESISNVLDKNEEKQQLFAIDDIVEKAKKCVSEIHQQQIFMLNEERKQFDALHSAYTRYQKLSALRIKRLTKDTYRLKYRKYNGCREILLEAIGNAGTYTKDAIVHRLTR